MKTPSPATLQFRRELKAAYAETLAEDRKMSKPAMFLVQVYDACSSEEIGLHTFESAEQAAEALGITWETPDYGKITHRANVPRGDYFRFTEPEDYDADDVARYNEYEDVYASGVYAKPGERIKWND